MWLLRKQTFPGGAISLQAFALPVAILSVVGMVSAANGHTHGAGGHGHDDGMTAAAGHDDEHADDHANGDDHGTDVETAAATPKPFDPAEPSS